MMRAFFFMIVTTIVAIVSKARLDLHSIVAEESSAFYFKNSAKINLTHLLIHNNRPKNTNLINRGVNHAQLLKKCRCQPANPINPFVISSFLHEMLSVFHFHYYISAAIMYAAPPSY